VAGEAQRDPAGVTLVPENALERALLAASEGGDAGAFLAELRNAEVLVPSDEPGDRTPAEGEEIDLPVFSHEDRRWVAAFTSDTQLRRGVPDAAGRLRLLGADLAAMWPPGVGLAVNPGGDLGVGLPEETVRALAA
jgi:hypothetical protein